MSSRTDTGGFTLVEMLVAVVILSIGALALAAASGGITRTLTGSRTATVASQVASWRLESLRAAAQATTPRCVSAAFTSSASPLVSQGVTEQWVVPASGSLRVVRVTVNYPVGGGKTRTDTVATSVVC